MKQCRRCLAYWIGEEMAHFTTPRCAHHHSSVRKAGRSRCGEDVPQSCFKGNTTRYVRGKVVSATNRYIAILEVYPSLFGPCRLLHGHPFDGHCFVVDVHLDVTWSRLSPCASQLGKPQRIVSHYRDRDVSVSSFIDETAQRPTKMKKENGN